MPQQQRVDQRFAHLADAHLQRAAVAHQALA